MQEQDNYIDPDTDTTALAQEFDTKISSGELSLEDVRNMLKKVNSTTEYGDGFIGAVITRLQAMGYDIEISQIK